MCAALSAQMMPPARPIDALDGLDPVLLVRGQEVPGKSAFTAVHGRYAYLFASAENKTAFEAAPDTYAIQLEGLCARMGGTTGGDPADFFVHDGRIYIFGSEDCHKRFAAAPAKYLRPAAAPMPSSAAAATRGRRLLDEAAAALGPAAQIDGLASFAETIVQVQARAQGEARIATRTIWKFPDQVRQERTITLAEREMRSATLMTPAGLWSVAAQGQAFALAAAGRPSLEHDYGRHPVALLRARHDPALQAAALGAADGSGTPLERVRVVRGGLDVTVDLDARRRLHGLTYVGRNLEGEYGSFVIRYGDYRAVDGLTLPFSATVSFDGRPEPSLSWIVDAVALNPAVDEASFAPPQAEPR